MEKYFILLIISFFTLQLRGQIFSFGSKKDSGSKTEKSVSKIKPYGKIIKGDAVTSKGLFTTHVVGENYYFELPQYLLDKEILVVSRISGFVKNLNFGGAGTKSRPQQVIRFQRKGDNILIREVSYNSVADEESPISASVKVNNFEPVIISLPIQAIGESGSLVIDVKPLFTKDIPMIGALYEFQKKSFGIRNIDPSRSFIESMKSFPSNVEVRHVLTYNGGMKLPDNKLTGTLSVELNQSFVLLPEKPMRRRLFDSRVGYFSLGQTDYSSDKQETTTNRYITRWRLEPKDSTAYFNGDLVEPIKPIVYYIDPATPEKWRKYIKQGVEDWRPVFEKAGFKNAIHALDPPSKEVDPDWTPEDIRYSVIRYVSTDIQNAMGPHVHDPRTGEILESDIIWYHNVMKLLRNWYVIQTAAVNEDARGVNFKEEVMGQLIRFVCAHEVGHTLGLPHNMGASVAYHVDSLRSPSFTKEMGTAPSIMDYARFNYIAQPEDGDVNLHPKIGPYDYWSIMYGYKLVEGANSPEEEKVVLNKWINERAGNPLFRFGRQRGIPLDPSSQTEDLGHNSMQASEYGIKNLKRIMPKLKEWTAEEGKNFKDLKELYANVIKQYQRYLGHVVANVGGVYENYQTYDENLPVYTYPSAQKQRSAILFLQRHLFKTPEWIIDTSILSRIEPKGVVDKIKGIQSSNIDLLLTQDRLTRMIENESKNGDLAYSPSQLFKDLEQAIFNSVKKNELDVYSRNLQKIYVNKLISIVQSKDKDVTNSDVSALARLALMNIKKTVNQNNTQSNTINDAHYYQIIAMIDSMDKK